jgi:hypothetical protein
MLCALSSMEIKMPPTNDTPDWSFSGRFTRLRTATGKPSTHPRRTVRRSCRLAGDQKLTSKKTRPRLAGGGRLARETRDKLGTGRERTGTPAACVQDEDERNPRAARILPSHAAACAWRQRLARWLGAVRISTRGDQHERARLERKVSIERCRPATTHLGCPPAYYVAPF